MFVIYCSYFLVRITYNKYLLKMIYKILQEMPFLKCIQKYLLKCH